MTATQGNLYGVADEDVADQRGPRAKQFVVPFDHVGLAGAATVPATVLLRQAGGATHFVVAWRRLGAWLQVMDPATGRRWVRCDRFGDELFRQELSVSAHDWRTWAASDDFGAPLRQRITLLGARPAVAASLICQAGADPGWFAFGALDAATRQVHTMVRAGGVRRGAEAVRLLQSQFDRAHIGASDIFSVIPAAHWSATPDPRSVELGEPRLILSGAVLLRLTGPAAAPVAGGHAPPQCREPQAGIGEQPVHPLRSVLALLWQDGLLGPLALVGAMAIAAATLIVEALRPHIALFAKPPPLGARHQQRQHGATG